MFAAMHAAGVVLVSGTDAGIGAAKPHGVLASAIAELAECGFSPAEALAAAPRSRPGTAGSRAARVAWPAAWTPTGCPSAATRSPTPLRSTRSPR